MRLKKEKHTDNKIKGKIIIMINSKIMGVGPPAPLIIIVLPRIGCPWYYSKNSKQLQIKQGTYNTSLLSLEGCRLINIIYETKYSILD